MTFFGRLPVIALLAVGCAGGASDDTDGPADDPAALNESEIRLLRQFWPLPAVPPDPTNAVADDPWAQHFGRYLFFETRLSTNGEVSCASCHEPTLGWADGLRQSDTLAPTPRHAPTIVNASYQRWQFWDGRCDSQWCQATKPFEDPREMGSDRVAVVRVVYEDPAMREAYEDLFGTLPDLSDPRFPDHARPSHANPDDPLHQAWIAMPPEDRDAIDHAFANLAKAIAAFERQIVSRDSAFDRWAEAMLMGDASGTDLISDEAKIGYKHFVGDGMCMACHSGPTFSNLEFHNVGVGERPWLDPTDTGRVQGILSVREDRFNGIGPHSDDPEFGAIKLDYLVITPEQDGQFKTPGLRDVFHTPPYNHGGQFETVEDVIHNYLDQDETPPQGHAEELLKLITMDEDGIDPLVAFLHTLEGAPIDPELTGPPADPRYVPDDHQ